MSYAKTPIGMAPRLADIKAWQDAIVNVNEANGWTNDGRTLVDSIALIASEAFEAFEDYRNGKKPNEVFHTHDSKCPEFPNQVQQTDHLFRNEFGVYKLSCCTLKPQGIPTEFADIFIRLLGEALRWDIDIAREVHYKLCYNATRGFRYGGKVI